MATAGPVNKEGMILNDGVWFHDGVTKGVTAHLDYKEVSLSLPVTPNTQTPQFNQFVSRTGEIITSFVNDFEAGIGGCWRNLNEPGWDLTGQRAYQGGTSLWCAGTQQELEYPNQLYPSYNY